MQQKQTTLTKNQKLLFPSQVVGGCGEEIVWWMVEGPAVQSAQSGSRRCARVVIIRDMTLAHHALVTLTYLGSLPFETLEPPIY